RDLTRERKHAIRYLPPFVRAGVPNLPPDYCVTCGGTAEAGTVLSVICAKAIYNFGQCTLESQKPGWAHRVADESVYAVSHFQRRIRQYSRDHRARSEAGAIFAV